VTDLSVVVVSYETRDLLLECLASVLAEARAGDLSVETWVVDNGSRDGSVAAVRERFPEARFPELRLAALPANRGFAAGANAGLRRARGRVVLLLNSDCRVLPGALREGVAALDAHPDVGLAGARLLHPDGRPRRSVHAVPRVWTELLPKGLLPGGRLARGRAAGGTAPVDVPAVAGAALFVRRAVVDAVGGLSADYFFFLEEIDWCGRMRRAGLRVVHLPAARFVHHGGASSARKRPGATRIEFHRSLYRFHAAHGGPRAAAAVRRIREAKTAFYLVVQAPAALVSARARRRRRAHRDVWRWHRRGRPEGGGLRPDPERGGLRPEPEGAA